MRRQLDAIASKLKQVENDMARQGINPTFWEKRNPFFFVLAFFYIFVLKEGAQAHGSLTHKEILSFR